MRVRAKFYVSKSSEMGYSNHRAMIYQNNQETDVPVREIQLSAVYDDKSSAENASFAQATPSGTITFLLNNPAVAEEFKPGDVYYVDFTKAE